MTHLLSHQELADLGAAIARSSVDTHADRIAPVIAAVDASGLHTTAATVLGDATEPEIVRQRAFATISQRWQRIRSEVLATQVDESFDALADQWNRHRQLRETGSISELSASRSKLDELRAAAFEVATARRAC